MKDAHGHGSNPKGGQAAAAAWRAAHPISHQQGVMQRLPGLIEAFAKDTSGAGHPEEENEPPKLHDPESTARYIGETVHALHSGPESLMEAAKLLLHASHYLT